MNFKIDMKLKMKIALGVLAVALLASNIITYKAIKICASITGVRKSAEAYKEKYEQAVKENEQLRASLAELEKSARKWDLYESRHGSGVSRADAGREALAAGQKYTVKRMRVTAYTEYECDKEPDHPEFRITSSGNEVEGWFTAAAGPELPFGTRLYIPYFENYENNGIFVVEDRGGAIKENCLDIYIADQKTVDDFGCKWLDVYIINEQPAK